MTFLLDVNALVALGFGPHEFHDRVARWLAAQRFPPLATCSITELGFIRVLAQAPVYGLSLLQARMVLLRLKQAGKPEFSFITDDHDVARLPGWVKNPRQTPDGHLAGLASAHGAVFATLDSRIPGAFLIPER